MRQTLAVIITVLLIGAAEPMLATSARLSEEPLTSRPSEEERGILALDQVLRDLSNPFTLVLVAVKPGDADEGTLAYYRRKFGTRTVVIYATRGEGDESPVTGETGADLGLIRTQEAIDAARIVGADVAFLNLRDAGYSKSADDVLSKWGHDEALRRLVRAIRLIRPDVIIGSDNPQSLDGRHQALARLTREAFEAASNQQRFPETAADAWQTRRMFCESPEATATVRMNLLEYDQLRGKTYAQIGLDAHRRHTSLGANHQALTFDRGKRFYSLIASSPQAASAMSDVIVPGAARSASGAQGSDDDSRILKSFLDGLKLPRNLLRSVEPPQIPEGIVAAATSPEKLFEPLREKLIDRRLEGGLDELRARHGPEFHRVVRFTNAIERALALILGLSFELKVEDPILVRGQKLDLRGVFHNRSNLALPVRFYTPERLAGRTDSSLKQSEVTTTAPGETLENQFAYDIPKDAAYTSPQPQHIYDDEYYALGDYLPDAVASGPFGSPVTAMAEVGLTEVTIRLVAAARYDVTPSVEFDTIPFAIVKDWTSSREAEVAVRLRNRTPGALSGSMWVVALGVTDENYEPARINFEREDQEVVRRLKLKLPILKPPLSPDVLIEFRLDKPASQEAIGSVKIPVKVVPAEVRQDAKVGYIAGFDSWLAFALTQLGVSAKEVKPDTINERETLELTSQVSAGSNSSADKETSQACRDLSEFDTIVIDERAYLARPEILRSNQCLLRFVQLGGNLVVLRQRADDWNLLRVRPPFAPYAIKLSTLRISLDSAPVRIVEAGVPLLSRPNVIAAADFDGWAGERASFIPREWASEFTAPFETGDPGEEARRGGLLVAKYGEGSFIYTTFEWRRQLLNAHAGAYRVFANLISQPRATRVDPQK